MSQEPNGIAGWAFSHDVDEPDTKVSDGFIKLMMETRIFPVRRQAQTHSHRDPPWICTPMNVQCVSK